MHSLSIALGNVSWRLLFKTKESIQIAVDTCRTGTTAIDITDDFGQQCFAVRKAIHGMLIEDMDLSKLGTIEVALHGARTNVDANHRAQTDPALRASRLTGGPAMIQPGIGNGRFS